MDYIMADAGPHPGMHIGDEAVIIGRQGTEMITPDEVALHGNTIGYEVLCNIGTTMDRIYVLNNRIISRDSTSLF